MYRAPKAVVKESTSAGAVAPMTTARIGGGDKKVVRKPTEKSQGTGLKPDALTAFVSGYRKKN